MLQGSTPKVAFLAYFLFQLGNFAAFSFIGTWLSDKFSLNVANIGTVILFLGLGNTISSLFGSSLVNKVGPKHSLIYGVIFIGLLYLLLPYLPSVTYVEITYFLIFLILGMIFPLMMSMLQTISATARGTVSSLANSSMYFGTMVGSFTAGMLYTHSGGFISVSLFSVICFGVSLILFLRSGVLLGLRLK